MDALQQQLLIKTFQGESNPNCFVLAAKFLLVLKLDFSHLPFTRVEYWDRLVQQFVSSRSQAVTESVLPLLGSLLSQVRKNSYISIIVNDSNYLLCYNALI